MIEDRCICGHIAQGHSVIDLSYFPYWDIGKCDYKNCDCRKFRRHEEIDNVKEKK